MSRIAKRSKIVPVIIGLVLIAIAGIGFYRAYIGVQNLDNVMVAPEDMAAFTFVTKEDLEIKAVPESSITSDDLTEDEYDTNYVTDGVDEGTVLTDSILAGQRIDERQVAENAEQSFAVVLPDERVVAANTTVAGAALGTIRAGDVVDVSSGSGTVGTTGGGSSDYAKVICIATAASQCESVLPPGVRLGSGDSGGSSSDIGSDEAGVIVLLAVDAPDAISIAGQSVTLSLNPFCRVDRSGYFVSTREGADGCSPPSERMASHAQQSSQSTEPATTTTTDGSSEDVTPTEPSIPPAEG